MIERILLVVCIFAFVSNSFANTPPYHPDEAHGPKLHAMPQWFFDDQSTNYVTHMAKSVESDKLIYDYEHLENVINGQKISGHKFIIQNPIGRFSILEPVGGCGHRVHTSDTAAASSCVIAQNAGFFDMRTGACLGNLVSNQHIVQTPGVWNTQFGLLADGQYVAGYVSAQNATNMGFAQLMAGVTWLVRDGKQFVDQSRLIEMPTDKFCTMKAPRTALGWLEDGALLIVSVDGDEPTDRGLSLYEFADLLISLGAVNAVNTDGGGSTTVYHNGKVINQPSDHCGPVRCERTVTTIVCVK